MFLSTIRISIRFIFVSEVQSFSVVLNDCSVLQIQWLLTQQYLECHICTKSLSRKSFRADKQFLRDLLQTAVGTRLFSAVCFLVSIENHFRDAVSPIVFRWILPLLVRSGRIQPLAHNGKIFLSVHDPAAVAASKCVW